MDNIDLSSYSDSAVLVMYGICQQGKIQGRQVREKKSDSSLLVDLSNKLYFEGLKRGLTKEVGQIDALAKIFEKQLEQNGKG